MVVPAGSGTWRMRWRSAALTDRGRRRDRNEDTFLERPQHHIYAVADGMGGHAAGDVASRLAIAVLDGAFAAAAALPDDPAALARRMAGAFAAANTAILQHSDAHPECGGMGTTLTAVSPLSTTAQCVIGHVGDSRAYLVRNGELTQLTRDHTWVQQQVDAGMLTARAARHHHYASVLNRVLGADDAGPDTFVVDAAPGDLLLLCSDGLTTMLDDADLHTLLVRELPLERHAYDLIEAANLRGGADNITVVLLVADRA
jgi:PPM family protein phosphatase